MNIQQAQIYDGLRECARIDLTTFKDHFKTLEPGTKEFDRIQIEISKLEAQIKEYTQKFYFYMNGVP